MPHRPDTWTDALFIYPPYHVNFLTSFMEWFRLFFFNGVTVKTENTFLLNFLWANDEERRESFSKSAQNANI